MNRLKKKEQRITSLVIDCFVESGTRRNSKSRAGCQISRDGMSLLLKLRDIQFRAYADDETRLDVRIPITWALQLAEALQISLVKAYVPSDVYGAATDLFQDNFAAMRWFVSPSSALKGKTPLEACAAGEGHDLLELTGKMEHGVFN
jgi:hypothetical protein